MGEIVVITMRNDAHVPYVQAHLKDELVLIDPLERDVSFVAEPGGAGVLHAGRRLDDVRSVWWRKPMAAVTNLVELNVVPGRRHYSARAISWYARQLHTSFRSALWMSDYSAVQEAESKTLQLDLAREVGLLVPDWVITADPEIAAAFMAAREDTIIKPLCTPADFDPTGDKGIFATRVHGPGAIDLSHLSWAPSIFQQAIPAVADLRVTIVVDKVFPAGRETDPTSQGPVQLRDWRYEDLQDDSGFRALEPLPRAVERKLVALLRRLKLRFASMDLVLDVAGDFWFLDLNPNGQWAFIEDEAGLPIGAALAGALERGESRAG